MGDSTCLLHGFSYASAIPNEYKQGNPIHVLGESISFGRFTSESLSWEKWSTFSHKKYVEEAERYAQPGSVAQKKAFFEAHYKRIAAQKAAALLEQQNAAAAAAAALAAQNEEAAAAASHDNDINTINDNNEEEEIVLVNSHSNVDVEMDEERDLVKIDEHTKLTVIEPAGKEEEICVITVKPNFENQDTISVSETSESTQMERPLLKQRSVDCEEVTSKRRSSPSSLKTSILHKTWRAPSTPATPRFKNENNIKMQSSSKPNVESLIDKRSSPPMSLRDLLNIVHSKEPDKQPVFSGLARTCSRPPHKDCSTPFKTPAPASNKSASTYPAASPRTESRRMKTPIDSSATGRKTSAPKWHILSAVCPKSLSAYRNKLQSPTVSTPFTLRTEERAARRKQKLEEKFNSMEAHKMQTQKTLKEKAGNEFRKLSCSLCFKARPLPDFYKDRETPNNHMRKTPAAAQPQTMVLGRSISNKKQGTVSMPPPPPPPTSLANKTRVYKQKNVVNQCKLINRSLHERITHENASPNIQQ